MRLRKTKSRMQHAFTSLSRNDNTVAVRAYYGPTQYPAPGHYRIDYTKILERSIAVQFNDSEPHLVREKVERVPSCIVN